MSFRKNCQEIFQNLIANIKKAKMEILETNYYMTYLQFLIIQEVYLEVTILLMRKMLIIINGTFTMIQVYMKLMT